MLDSDDIDARSLETARKAACTLVSDVLEKCKSEITLVGEKRATVESITKRNIRGFGLLIRRLGPAESGTPASIWFFPDVDLIAIESCYPDKPQTLSYFDVDDLDERFIWEHVSRFISEMN